MTIISQNKKVKLANRARDILYLFTAVSITSIFTAAVKHVLFMQAWGVKIKASFNYTCKANEMEFQLTAHYMIKLSMTSFPQISQIAQQTT